MKDSEFFELLNLYLDHEITPGDAARLEAEVQRNLSRRQIYRQYCQMQKACTSLAKDFADEAPAAAGKVVAFPGRRSAWSPAWLGVGGLVAAAACAAVIFVARTSPGSISGNDPVLAKAEQPMAVVTPVVQPVAVAQPAVRTIPQTVTMPARRNDLQLVLTTSKLPMMTNSSALAATPAALDWIQGVKLSPMPTVPTADDLRFERQSTLQPENAVYHSRVPLQSDVHMTAFQFQH
jgi:hypothetical protein